MARVPASGGGGGSQIPGQPGRDNKSPAMEDHANHTVPATLVDGHLIIRLHFFLSVLYHANFAAFLQLGKFDKRMYYPRVALISA